MIPNTDNALPQAIYNNYTINEDTYLENLLTLATPTPEVLARITSHATDLVKQIRASRLAKEGVEAFLQQYRLETQEGMILMCLAEALLRIPDADVANKLIKDNFSAAHWKKYLGQSPSWLVNASTWGLMLTGYVVKLDKQFDNKPAALFKHLISRLGEPVIRTAIMQAMKLMGRQFVLGRTLDEAFKHSRSDSSYTFDMLGEAALTQADADRFFSAYYNAIATLGQRPENTSSVSIKLSALHPRYERAKRERVLKELGDKLIRLVEQARVFNVPITIDAEEIDRLELSLELFEKVFSSNICRDWDGFGLAVQTYSKQALPVLYWLNHLAKKHDRRIPLRLVKGAYWDSEIKKAQQLGISTYPVLTHKAATDVSYLACARYIFNCSPRFYPQFATHNAQTAISLLEMAGDQRDFEFQRLHGMGEALFEFLLRQYPQLQCRIYAPVGEYKELLPYLVRRLLENGANTSFVHRLVDDKTPIENLVKHPVEALLALQQSQGGFANQKIVLPSHIYGDRKNSRGINLNAQVHLQALMAQLETFRDKTWQAAPIIDGQRIEGESSEVVSPYDNRQVVGTTISADTRQAEAAIAVAEAAVPAWNSTPVAERAKCLERVADLFEENLAELIILCSREGGKTILDGVREVREAVDFCRYYAQRADSELQGRGVFVCISPWNFPLAIFTGQVTAALVAGNCVIAKPASPTPLVACRAIELMHQAGIPTNVLHFLPGRSAILGKVLSSDPRIAGIAFTGSTETAQIINRLLAARDCDIAPLIAETGGQNAMLVDSSALPQQVVNDVIQSAFNSAGQRCSALRVLYLQEEIAPKVLEILKGAMMEIQVGDPTQLATDVGPVINGKAKAALETHISSLRVQTLSDWVCNPVRNVHQATLICETPLDETSGHFVAPIAFEIKAISDLTQEHFGPILHVIRYAFHDLDKVIDSINNYGYGLTLGVHSRDESTARYICQRAKVGNIYVNRDIIGAIVGTQPFGGMGLSGTGPKAGGPYYLSRFALPVKAFENTLQAHRGEHKIWHVAPIINGKRMEGERQDVYCLDELVGSLIEANAEHAEAALKIAAASNTMPVEKRAECLERLVELFKEHGGELVALCESNETEVNKAIHYCAESAQYARTEFARIEQLPGPTGERNELHLRERGIFACITSESMSIFTRLVTGALAAGNRVIAKPAKTGSLVSYRIIELMYEAGIPSDVLHFLPGNDALGELLASDARIAGVAFSGKAEMARRINRILAARESAIVPLIFENDALHRFATEQTYTYNTAALGGNATLFSLGENYNELM
jgi:RHH-type proline utilization regulon transcriptional repressor/proline dehydrogenase/delta 1-pyrroline-5-carboxylate dehydrogenase